MILAIVGIIFLFCGFVGGRVIDKDEYPGLKKAIPIIGVLLAIILVILSCVSYVPTGYTGIVTTFGKVEENTLDAGIAFHLPWQNVVKMDNREQRVPFQLEAFSRIFSRQMFKGRLTIILIRLQP